MRSSSVKQTYTMTAEKVLVADGDKLVDQQVTAPTKVNVGKVALNLMKPVFALPITPGFDMRSFKGQFGWITFGEEHVPYIFRGESSQCVSLRIVNQNVFPSFFRSFKQELFDMFVMRCWVMTDMERRLYNEINVYHCNCKYGLNPFQADETLVMVNDVVEMYNFLVFLHARLVKKRKEKHPNYGYMTFNVVNLVPFVRICNEVCFPAVYFEGDERFLTERSKAVSSFQDSALKVLMKLQRVGFTDAPMHVLTLGDIVKYFERNSVFADSWLRQYNDVFTSHMRGVNTSILRVVNTDFASESVNTPINVAPMEMPVIKLYGTAILNDYGKLTFHQKNVLIAPTGKCPIAPQGSNGGAATPLHPLYDTPKHFPRTRWN